MKSLFDLDIDRLSIEIEQYNNNADLWILDKQINNSAGNLALHLCGNLQHFFGAVILKDGYQRDRDFEFKGKNIPKVDLLAEIEKSKIVVLAAIDTLGDEMMSKTYPIEVFGFPMTYNYFVLRLLGHLNYHLGQISYHRRLLTS
ncbi:MAG: DUF1572 domain-containing protein [Reichenbachiella sp.]